MGNLQEWIVPILTSIVAIAVAIMTCKWQMRTELRKILESYVSDKKYKAYYDAVNIVFTLFVYGSDDAFRSFTEYLCSCTPNSDGSDVFKPLLDFMLIVRREISGGKSSISIDDIMLNLMQSKEELHKYHEFLKTNGI